MIRSTVKKMFGSKNDRELKLLQPMVDRIDSLESQFETLTDEELTAKTDEFKMRFAAGETLDDLLPEAFAVVREGSKRVLGMRPLMSS